MDDTASARTMKGRGGECFFGWARARAGDFFRGENWAELGASEGRLW